MGHGVPQATGQAGVRKVFSLCLTAWTFFSSRPVPPGGMERHGPAVTLSEQKHSFPLVSGGTCMAKMALATLGGGTCNPASSADSL